MSDNGLDIEDVMKAVLDEGRPITRREIGRRLNIKDGGKIAIKAALKQLMAAGRLHKLPSKAYEPLSGESQKANGERVMVLRISKISLDGDVYASPADGEKAPDDLPAHIYVEPAEKATAVPDIGERILARIKTRKDGTITARIMRCLGAGKERVMLGRAQKSGDAWYLQPVNRKERDDYALAVPLDMQAGLEVGALVEAHVDGGKLARRPKATLHCIIGHDDDPKAISLIAMHEQGLRNTFPDKAIKQTEKMQVPELGKRTDLRDIPLVTIDGADARDFDDAVFAESTDDGFHLIVAIADVAYYVRTGTALDEEAYNRGNSTYFPDRVVPMLPEGLSNDLCSLRPKEDRACMAVHLYIDHDGNLKSFKFVRALMRSVARLTYEQVQKAIDGMPDDVTDPLMVDVIRPLYAAFEVLEAARKKRGALEINMPERQILVDETGQMTGVQKRARYDAHKLIEEFMILANVAAAKALEAVHAPCIYRVHDTPSAEKVDGARGFLEGFGLNLARGAVMKPALFNSLLKKVEDEDYAPLVNQVILRTQSQAVYSPDNIGHFGLALAKYAHFTSPIRRYADLVVHRSLIAAYKLGEGALKDDEHASLPEVADHITKCERNSMLAERSAVDRFTAAWLSTHIDEVFAGRIASVTRFGLFVSLNDTGADGLVPVRTLPGDYYIHSEEEHALIGRRTGTIFRLCAPVWVRVKEADRLTGSSVFELVDAEDGADIPGYKPAKPRHTGKKQGGKKPDFKKGKRPFKSKAGFSPKPKRKKGR